MKGVLSRPRASLTPGAGLLRREQFQVAYATTDIERACAIFGQRFGIKEFRRLEGPLPAGGQIRIELAWSGGVMYELLWADGPGSQVFRAGLPSQGFAIRHHHLGYFVPDEAAWTALKQEIEKAGIEVLHWTNVPGFMQAFIIDAPELGHYLEYLFPDPAGLEFFEGSPNN